MFNKIEIFSKGACPSCNTLKNLIFNDFDHLFENISIQLIDTDITVEELTEILGFKPRAVPQVIIDGQYIGSFRQTMAFLERFKQEKNI